MKRLYIRPRAVVRTVLALVFTVTVTGIGACGAMDEHYDADFPRSPCPTLKERFGELVRGLDDEAWPATQGFARGMPETMKRDVFEAGVTLFERGYLILKYGASPLPDTLELRSIQGPDKDVLLAAVATGRATLDACHGVALFPLLRAAADDPPFFDASLRVLLEGGLLDIASRYCDTLAGGACDADDTEQLSPIDDDARAVEALLRFLLTSMSAMKVDADPAVVISLLGVLMPPSEAPFDEAPYPAFAEGFERYLLVDEGRLATLLTLLHCAGDEGLLDVAPALIALPYASLLASTEGSGNLKPGATDTLGLLTHAILDLNEEDPSWLAGLLRFARRLSEAPELPVILDEASGLVSQLLDTDALSSTAPGCGGEAP
jgi:hypothetical protein